MKEKMRPFAIKSSYLLMLVYFASYCTRINFAVMLVKIGSDMNVEKTDLAIVVTALTVAYGLGQVISGFLGDKIKPQLMLTIGLAVASVCNASMFFCTSVPVMTVVWCINGLAQSMLWPPIVKIMSTYLTDLEYSYAAVRVSWGSSIATILLYSVVPLLLYVIHWKYVMLICATIGISVMVLWNVCHPSLFKDPASNSGRTPAKMEAKTVPIPRYGYVAIVLIMVGIILQGTLRDGVTNWMPSYLNETFNIGEEKSIITTVILAIFSMISFVVFDTLHRKVFKNEVTCSAVIFAGSAACAVVMFVLNRYASSVLVSTLMMACIVACMHGINLMLITVVPKRTVKSGKVSTYSGILNACTYVGASISTYGFAALADSKGWDFTVLMWAIISVAGLAVCAVVAPIWKKFCRDYANS